MSDQPSSRGSLGEDSRPRKGRTIDLQATDVENADAQSKASDAQPATSAPAEQAPDAAADSSQDKSADAGGPARSRNYSNWKALIAGGVGGAIIAGAISVGGLLLIRDTDLKELGARVSGVEGRLEKVRSEEAPIVQGLANRVAKLEATIARLASAPLDVAAADRFSALENDLKALAARIGTAAQQAQGAADAARDARQRSETNAAALTQLENKVATAADSTAREKIAADIRSLADRMAAVESKLSKARDNPGRLAAATIALSSTLERGQPFAPELAAVKSLGAEPELLAPLEPFAQSGLPTPTALSHELLDLMPLLRTIEPGRGSILSKLQANAERLVRIRPQDAKGGNEISAILDRIEIKAANADLGGALAELEQLPPAIRAPADAWIRKATARSAAVQTSQRLLGAALAGLSK